MKMQTAVAVLSVYSEPSVDSVLTNQLLFGETVKVIEETGNFAKIIADYDGTEGFAEIIGLEPATGEVRTVITKPVHWYGEDLNRTLLSIGSEVLRSSLPVPHTKPQITDLAVEFLNVPYLKGGRSYFGADSAGFVQLFFKVLGIKLPRTSYEQAQCGEVLDFINESAAGDLAFFEDEVGTVNHTGIMMENCEILHCYGKVRRDLLDTAGIYNRELKKHTHRLRFIRKLI